MVINQPPHQIWSASAVEPKRGEVELHQDAARERLHVRRVGGISAHHAVSAEILGQIQQREETGS